MRIVEDMGKCREGGSCANCNGHYRGNEGQRVIAEYYDGIGFLAEPFNLCPDCYKKLKEQ